VFVVITTTNAIVNVVNVLDLQWSPFNLHIHPLQSTCSSPSGNLMSCSLLTPWLYSLSYFSYGNVIYGISYLCSLGYLYYGDVIYSTITIYLTTCTIIGTTFTTISIVDGSTLPFIIFYALKSMFSCSLFIPKLEASLS